MVTLERAIRIATEAHEGQKDKAGAPYILHVLRVMLSMTSDAERIVAVLHDVVEDTPWTLDALRAEGFGADIVAAIGCLTHREGETYDAFIQRVSTNDMSRRVKLADLADNANLSRFQAPTEQDRARVLKYEKAMQLLKASSPAGEAS
jgi:(p)ppGpp synthase/HD superfamily hydrolase